MKTILAKILLFIMIINGTLSSFTFNAFAKNKPKADSKTNFEWNKNATLDEGLNIVDRKPDSNEVLLMWDIENVNGSPNNNGSYTLTYPIADNKVIEFEITRNNDKSIIEYKVNGENKVNKNNKPLLIYKEGAYLPANKNNFPPTEAFELNKIFTGNGDASAVSFKIGKNSGATFKYENNTIKFLWKDSKMYFVTDAVLRGNIYNFQLKHSLNGQNGEENKKIFLGIDTINGFKVQPFANADNNTNKNGKDLIDQTKRPITEYPGSSQVGVNITFNTPKEWKQNPPPPPAGNKYKGTYDFIASKPPTEVVFNLWHPEQSKRIQVKIADIYKDNNITINGDQVNPQGKITAEYKYDDANHNGTLRLVGLEASTIYNDISISTERKGDPFESIPATLPVGAVYTYPAYKVIARGLSEFYLEIEPYKGYNGFYVVYQGDQASNLIKWATYEDKTEGKNKIFISVPLDAEAQQEKFFRVDFSFTPPSLETTKLPFTSQVLQYKPYEQDIVLATPKNLKIISSNIIKKDNEHENLFLSLKWDIDNQRVIENLMKQNQNPNKLDINYLFYKGDKPTELDKELLSLKLTFENKDVKYTLNDPQPQGIEVINDKTYTSTRVEVINNKPTTILEANVTFKIPVSAKDSNNKLFFEYPGTYFLATKGEYEITTDKGTLPHKTDLSLPVTLTLDGIQNIPVPTPQNLKIVKDSVSKNSFSIEYDPLKYKNEDDLLYEYNEIMLKTIDRELRDESINYDFYITQDKSLFDEIVKLKKDDEIPSNIQSKITEHKLTEEMTENGISIDFKSSAGSEQLVDILRSKGIVKISDIKQKIDLPKQKLNFLGLDENETYYVMGKTIITPYEKQPTVPMPQPPPISPFNQNKNLQDNAIINVANNSSTIKKDSSTFSKILTVTTIDPQSPSENEKIPPAPTKFIAENITLNSVELVWDRVKDSFPEVSEDGKEKSTLEYQFLKTRGEQLPDSFLKSKDSFEKTWQSLDKIKNKSGIKTAKNNIFEFDDSTKSFSTTAAVKEKYEYIQWEGSEGRIADKTLSPNQIYFYYIRTVRTSEKDGEVYSVWVPLSFTTKNTEGPKNLRVEPKEEYNKKSEVVISFDIPKMDINSIGQEYDLQYSIKEDLGEWSKDITMDKAKLSFKENDDGKTIKVKYKISGLKSGKMYTIRVRMVNKPLNAPSVYSNEVEHRTSSDNNDNDYDENVNNWEINFKDLIEKLKNESYWFAQNNSSNTVVYYRPQYFDKVISSTNNSIIDLALGKGGSYKQYYLPASAIIKAFEQNKGFKISFNNADVIFSAKTINPDDHEIIKKISEEIKSKNSSISDYFIKLSVDFNNNKYIINGSDSISPLAKINVSVIGTKNKIIDLDQKMLDYIEELLKSKEFSEDVKSKIQELVKDKADNKIMVQEIAKLVDRFKLNFGDKLNKSLYNIEEKIYDLKYLTNDIIFAYPAQQGISINGYKKAENRWIGISAKDYLGKKAIYTRETGEYIFTGKKLVINGLSNLQNSNQITNIVIKYNLDDFLGKNGNINLKAPISKHSVIGSLSRVAGANNTQDPVEFFKTKDIIISTRNMDKNITSEEAVYLIMKVYEMKTKTKLETIKIKNYSLTKDIKNVNNNYKKPIQVAFQTGIYNNPNMNAKGTISVQEFLQSLANMSTMIGI